MGKFISVDSFRGGTGKSNTTANIAVQLAMTGQKVGVIDTDIQSPGIHVLFGMLGTDVGKTLNDYLWNKAPIVDAAYDVTPSGLSGQIFLIPSSSSASEIVSVLREGYNVSLLTTGFRQLLDELSLDVLLIDTHPGLNEETLFSIAIRHALVVIMRPDHQDYEGTGVTVEVARSLEVPRMKLVVNKTPSSVDVEGIRARVSDAYGVSDVDVLPHSDEMMMLASGGVFSVEHPDHSLASVYRALAHDLVT